MDSSIGRDYTVQRSSREGVPSASREDLTVASAWGSTASLFEEGEPLPSGPVAWRLGHRFLDQHEYERAAECFRRVLVSSEGSTDPLSARAAETAIQLCVALSQERAVREKLLEVRRVLDQGLSQLSYEEVGIAGGAISTCAEAWFTPHYPASTASMPGEDVPEMVEMTADEASDPGLSNPSFHRSEDLTRAADADNPRLRVHFFGRFELLRDGEVARLGRNAKALAILKYLLARRGGRPVSQDYLMGWLWSESDPKRARWSLNSSVYVLRKLLCASLSSSPASKTILFEERGYRLSPRVLLEVDTEEFDSHYEEGCRLEEAGRVPEAILEYEKAAALYRGDYLLEDLYEEWTMIERERLLDAYTDLLRRLAARYMENGRLRESARVCYQLLEKDSCDEHTHRLLMECYVGLGQRSRALRQYRLCERALQNEYDTAPSPETRELYVIILRDVGRTRRRIGASIAQSG